MRDKHDYTGNDDHFRGNGKDMQVDKAGRGRTGDEKNGKKKKKDNLLQKKGRDDEEGEEKTEK